MDDLTGYVFDDDLAIEPLNKLGWEVETISWRDKTVNWDDFTAVIIRTTWDYQEFPDEFLAVLQEIDASKARLENQLEIVEWNLSKLYLRELEQNGIKIVPTIWDEKSVIQEKCNEWKTHFATDEIIIKPLISATAGYTYRLKEFVPELTATFENRPFMVQKFIPNVVSEGEFSLFYFGENYSHTILKTPKPKDFRVQEEHGGLITAVNASQKLLQSAERVLDFINPCPLYARIDFVRDEAGDFCLMELELIEPALYLRMDENAPQLFAKTIDNWLKKMNNSVKNFWHEFCSANKVKIDTPYQIWYFGNNQKLAKELAELVMSGKKRATASLVAVNNLQPEIAPIDDGYSVVTDFEGNPMCIIQTNEIQILPFDEVDAQFAFDEGEGDQTLEDWREGHWRYFTKEAAELGIEFNTKSLICCERFSLIYPIQSVTDQSFSKNNHKLKTKNKSRS